MFFNNSMQIRAACENFRTTLGLRQLLPLIGGEPPGTTKKKNITKKISTSARCSSAVYKYSSVALTARPKVLLKVLTLRQLKTIKTRRQFGQAFDRNMLHLVSICTYNFY